jgi:ketosteroid isomerase-like protein
VRKKLENDGLALTHVRWRLVGTDPDGESVEMTGEGTAVSLATAGWKLADRHGEPIRPQ